MKRWLKVWHDEDAFSPLEDDENAPRITYRESSRYVLGNEPIGDSIVDHLTTELCASSWFGYDRVRELCRAMLRELPKESRAYALEDYRRTEDWQYVLEQNCPESLGWLVLEHLEDAGLVWLPVYAYIHSGVVLNTGGFSCPWDSGQSGIIYATPELLTSWGFGEDTGLGYPIEPEKIKEQLRTTVEVFSDYLGGNCYGFETAVSEDNDLDDPDDADPEDSCGGFIGWDPSKSGMVDYVPDEARPYLDEAHNSVGDWVLCA
jgi:hypothetical protein